MLSAAKDLVRQARPFASLRVTVLFTRETFASLTVTVLFVRETLRFAQGNVLRSG
jgi:hypothetical protein